jgi:exopolysaccharide biosynthesis protein
MIAVCVLASPKPAYHWNLLSDGIVYTKYSFEPGEQELTTIHAFQIDPDKVRLDVVTADTKQSPGATVKELAQKKRAALVINGGFFTEDRKSIGLLIQSGKIVNPIHKTSWWSIFGLKEGVPFITIPKDFSHSTDVTAAVQAGPRLVIDGNIPTLKEGVAARSAVGITKEGKIILLVTEGSPITLEELARRMKKSRYEGGLECVNAMAFDGGGSTQLYAKIKNFELSIEGISYITNGLAVFAK